MMRRLEGYLRRKGLELSVSKSKMVRVKKGKKKRKEGGTVMEGKEN